MNWFALIVVLAVWIGTDEPILTKFILSVIYLAIWGVTWFWPWAYFALLLYGLAVYFLYFGSSPGKRWRR
jgi:hypothetical protein